MKKIVASSIALSLIASVAHANESSDLKVQLETLKKQTALLQEKVDALSVDTAPDIKQVREATNLHAGPHFGIDATYDGAKLLINEPSLNKDIALLKQKQFFNKAFGSVGDSGARVMLSGTVGADFASHSDLFGKDIGEGKSNLAANAELDISAQLNDWWTAYTKFEGNSSDLVFNFNQALVTLGNLDETPFYGSTGYYFLPNGFYATHMVSPSLTKSLLRTKAKAVTFGATFANGVNTSVFAYDGNTTKRNNGRVDQWGANLEYAGQTGIDDLKVKMGASYTSNLASSDGMKTPFKDNEHLLTHYVPAADVRFAFDYGALGFASEYATATKNFALADLSINSGRANPSAQLLETYYNFSTLDKPSYVAFSYGKSKDALGLKMPEKQYGVTYSVNLFKNTLIYVEYLRKKDYGRSVVAGTRASTINGTGLTDNVVTLEVDTYF